MDINTVTFAINRSVFEGNVTIKLFKSHRHPSWYFNQFQLSKGLNQKNSSKFARSVPVGRESLRERAWYLIVPLLAELFVCVSPRLSAAK